MKMEDVTDASTAQMCADTGHQCPACPSAVRNLYATAFNAESAIMEALAHNGSWERAQRKLVEMKRAVDAFRAEHVNEHFKALEAWRLQQQ